MGRRLTRRTLLVDLGRSTLAAVVLGPVLTGCDEGPSDALGASDDSPAWRRASFGFVSAYVLVRDGAALIFDTGTGTGGVGPIGDALAAAAVGWEAVSDVLVSHEHSDHAGGAGALATEAPAAVLHAARPDLDAIEAGGLAVREVVDGDRVLGVRVIATPGHTAGHVSALDEDGGILLVGDALVNGVAIGGSSGDGVELSPPNFTADAEAAAASGRVLAGLTFDVALFGHGEPIEGDAAATVAAAVGSG